MRNIFIKATAVVSCALVLFSCNKKELEEVVQESGPVEYICRIVNSETRTVLEDNVVKWEVNDQLGFYTSTDTYNSYKKITTISPEVQFPIYLTSALAPDDELYAYFPYKSNSSAKTDGPTKVKFEIPTTQANDFDAMPQVSKVFVADAQTTSGSVIDLEFINLGSVAQFLVFSEDASIRSESVSAITFEANQACAGPFTYDISGVDYDTPSTLEISGYTETGITVNASPVIGTSKADAGVVNMVVAPGSYTGVVKVITSAATYVFNVNSALAFARAHKKPLGLKLDAAHRESLPIKTFKKITSAPVDWTAKEYILVNSDGNSVMTGQLAGNYLASETVAANSDGSITCLASFAFTIERLSNDFYAIKNSDGKYIAMKESQKTTAALKDNATSKNAQFAISLTSTGLATINCQLQTTRFLTYKSGTDWRFYADDSNKGYFYELVDSRVKLASPVVTCTTEGASITASWGPIENAGRYLVLLTDTNIENPTAVVPSEFVTGTTKTFTDLEAGMYIVSVIALPSDADNYLPSDTGFSDEIKVGTPALESPTITEFAQMTTGFSAEWTAGDSYTTNYDWELYEDSLTGNKVGEGNTNATSIQIAFSSLSIDEFTSGKQYFLVVVAKATGYASSVAASRSFTAMSSSEASITSFSAISGSIDNNISYEAVKGGGTTNPAIYNNQLRLYKPASGGTGSKLTVTARSGFKITSITFKSDSGFCRYSTDGGTLSSTQTVGADSPLVITDISAQTVELYNTGSDKININTIEVKYQIQ